MRILIVIDKFINPTHGSGVASWAIDLRDEWQRQGVWCEVAGYYDGPSEFDINGKNQKARDEQLIRLVESHHINCVISGTSWTAFNVWDRIDDQVIKIATIHGAKESIVERELLADRKVDAFICVSEPVKEITKRYQPSKPVYVVNNGIELSKIERQERPKKRQILWIGRLQIEQKRAHWLKPIAEILAKNSYSLHVVGDGFVASWLKKKGAPGIVWHRKLNRSEVARLMDESDAVLFTSCYEGLSISLLEAMKHGCVIVAPNLARMKSGVLNQDNAILYNVNGGMMFKKNYSVEFDKAIQRLKQGNLGKFIENATETLKEKCSLENQAKEYLNIIAEIAARKSSLVQQTSKPVDQFQSLRYRRFGILERNYQRVADKFILHLS